MPQLLGLIFDLDGTLVDSAVDLRLVLNRLLESRSRPALGLDDVRGMTGDGLYPMLARAFAATGPSLPEDGLRRAFDEFLSLYERQPGSPEMLYPHAKETLETFRAAGVRLGLCTNKIQRATLRLLAEVGIAGFFDFVAGGDAFSVCKPHPDHVRGVVQHLSVASQSCAMIGDSRNDINAARGAGIASIAVAHGYGADVHSLGADAVIAGFPELPQALRRLGFAFG